MSAVIPLDAGFSYQQFTIRLAGRLITFRLRWMERFGFYSVDLYQGGEAIILGRGLHPEQDILDGVITDLEAITLKGEPPTVKNLGIANQLIYGDDI